MIVDGDVVGLVHLRFVGEHVDPARLHVDAEDVVVGVVGDEHAAGAVEACAVAGAAVGQVEEHARVAGGGDLAHRVVAFEADGVQVALSVARGALDACGEPPGRGEVAGDVERVVGGGGVGV